MRPIVLTILALVLAGCATGSAVSPQTAQEDKPQKPPVDNLGTGGY